MRGACVGVDQLLNKKFIYTGVGIWSFLMLKQEVHTGISLLLCL